MARLVQVTFGDRNVPEELAWATIILIMKGKGEYQGIGLVEVLWKVRSVVVNCHLKNSVMLHDTLHGFREGWGTGTANLDAKLAQQLSGIAHNTLFQVVLHVCKVYDLLGKGRCMEILRGYGLGPNLAPVTQESLEMAEDCTKGREVTRDSIWDRERSDTGRPPIPHNL